MRKIIGMAAAGAAGVAGMTISGGADATPIGDVQAAFNVAHVLTGHHTTTSHPLTGTPSALHTTPVQHVITTHNTTHDGLTHFTVDNFTGSAFTSVTLLDTINSITYGLIGGGTIAGGGSGDLALNLNGLGIAGDTFQIVLDGASSDLFSVGSTGVFFAGEGTAPYTLVANINASQDQGPDVPEPGSLGLLGASLLGLFGASRKRKKA